MLVESPTRSRLAQAPPTARERWSALVETDASALVSQAPEWLDVLCRSGFEDATRAYETATGAQMLLPLARRVGSFPRRLAPLASMPAAWGMGGLLTEEPPSVADVAHVVEDLRSLPALQVLVRPNPIHAQLWDRASRGSGVKVIPRRAHVLDLAGGASVVWSERFSGSARRAVRKAEAANLEIRSGSDHELLVDFRRLFELSVERWAVAQGEPVALARVRAYRRDPPAKFLHLARALPEGVRVLVAYDADVPIAGLIVLLGANASYTRGAMDKSRAGSLRANELLQWRAIKEACAAGCRHYHFGETANSASLARFKEKFGAVALPYAEYRFERLPITRASNLVRSSVKRAIGFHDA